MATALSAKPVGSSIVLELNGAPTQFFIVHQGCPDPSLYQGGAGTWLMASGLPSTLAWGSGKTYAQCTPCQWLSQLFIPMLDETVQQQLVAVRLPYSEGGTLHAGAEGLEAKAFLLSGTEMGWSDSTQPEMPVEGVCLDYFEGFADQDARRIAKANGSPYPYWTRTRSAQGDTTWVVSAAGGTATTSQTTQLGVRPILILPQGLSVDDEGNIQPNAAPTLTSPSGASGANIGIRSAPFLYEYTPTDPEGLSLSLTEKLDEEVTRTLTGASGAAQSFAAVGDSLGFLKLSNGTHTLEVTASDGMASTSLSAVFTKSVTSASVTLTQPIPADAPITTAVLSVGGSIPADASLTVQVTNNALDDQPVWQDATAAVHQGANILFSNKTALNGPAFNFKVEAGRGVSGTGGYIDSISGAFQ